MCVCFPKEFFHILRFWKFCCLWLNTSDPVSRRGFSRNSCSSNMFFQFWPVAFSVFLLLSFTIFQTKWPEIFKFQVTESPGANFRSHNLANRSFNSARRRQQSITLLRFDSKTGDQNYIKSDHKCHSDLGLCGVRTFTLCAVLLFCLPTPAIIEIKLNKSL